MLRANKILFIEDKEKTFQRIQMQEMRVVQLNQMGIQGQSIAVRLFAPNEAATVVSWVVGAVWVVGPIRVGSWDPTCFAEGL